jgi:hypothetical protein
MKSFEPERILRWLDDVDCAAGALRLALRRRRPRSVPILPLLLVAVILLLGPSVGM